MEASETGMTTISAVEMKALRAEHKPNAASGFCWECTRPYPCPTIRLLDEAAALRAALLEYGGHLRGCSAAFNRDPQREAGLEPYRCRCGWDEAATQLGLEAQP